MPKLHIGVNCRRSSFCFWWFFIICHPRCRFYWRKLKPSKKQHTWLKEYSEQYQLNELVGYRKNLKKKKMSRDLSRENIVTNFHISSCYILDALERYSFFFFSFPSSHSRKTREKYKHRLQYYNDNNNECQFVWK